MQQDNVDDNEVLLWVNESVTTEDHAVDHIDTDGGEGAKWWL
jgi:hypothetical protein